jgi:hypothetical protein
MDIRDIRNCADHYQENFLETFYLVSTYNGKSFMLVGEKGNFPHLMGIARNTYNSNGYRTPHPLYNDILERKAIPSRIIPSGIPTTSIMYKKASNFQENTNVFWKNQCPLVIDYDAQLAGKKLDVNILIADIKSGYMLGWTDNKKVQINAEITLKKYCISSWIDESAGSAQRKEKYLPSQDIELIRHVFSFDKHSDLLKQKEYSYDADEKKYVLLALERNGANLLINAANERFYAEIARSSGIHCKINGIQL